MQITLNQGLSWIKTLRERHNELINLRNQNSTSGTRLYGDQGKEVDIKPIYDCKAIDKLINVVAKEIRNLDDAIKATNATTMVANYDKNEDVLGELA